LIFPYTTLFRSQSKNSNRIIHFRTPVQEGFGFVALPCAHLFPPTRLAGTGPSRPLRTSEPGQKRHRVAALPNTPCPVVAGARPHGRAACGRAQRSKESR